MPISDGEVAYFTLHFGAHLRKEKKVNEKIRVLVVCSNGISAGNMIKHELLKMLPEIDVVGVVPSKNVVNVQNICDIVISTVKMNCLVPVIVVHPILTDFDRKIILNHSMFRNLHGNVDVDELFDRIKKFAPKENHDALKIELISYFEESTASITPVSDKNKKGLLELLPIENISVEKENHTWEQALRRTAQPLIDKKTLNQGILIT